MRKLRVGVWVQDDFKQTSGGGYTYYTTLMDNIATYQFENAELVFLGEGIQSDMKIGEHNVHSIISSPFKLTFFERVAKKFASMFFFSNLVASYFAKKELNDNDKLNQELSAICDVIYYPTPMLKYIGFPFIYTLWDLGHLSCYAFPSFPSLANTKSFHSKKNSYELIYGRALFVLCESVAGKNQLIKYFNFNEERIRILPLFPGNIINADILPQKPQELAEGIQFIHYPGQYLAHKNHYNLLIAMMTVITKYPQLKLVLTGADHGNKNYINNSIKSLGLTQNIIDLGFVSTEELKYLYLHSKGLIMPTFLGPTNMPPLEALFLNCPVAVSDLPGHREQLGENAIYFNPIRPAEIADAIFKLLLIDRENFSINKEAFYIPTAAKNMRILDNIFADMKGIRFAWE